MNVIPHGTPEWVQARLGKLTASRMSDATAEAKSGGWRASREEYMTQLLTERLTGEPVEQYVTRAMQDGMDTEPEALAAYAFRKQVDVEPGGFVQHPTIAMSGGSPDGFVGKVGLVQVKCPLPHTHAKYLRTEKIPEDYIKQVQWEMACAERKWCDWVSYCKKMPEEYQLLIIRVARDDAMIAKLTSLTQAFLRDLDQQVVFLRRRYGGKPTLKVVA